MTTNLPDFSRRDVLKLAGATAAVVLVVLAALACAIGLRYVQRD